MNNIQESMLEKIFTDSVKDPLTYNLNINNIEDKIDTGLLFEYIKNIFISGIKYITDNVQENKNDKNIILEYITDKEINKMKEYMISMGIELIYKKYNEEDRDFHIRSVLYDIENIENIKIDILSDWKSQLIKNISIQIKKEQANELKKKIIKYPEANYFLNLYTPEKIEDFRLQYIKKDEPNIINIIYFKPAKILDYHYLNNNNLLDPFNKHIR